MSLKLKIKKGDKVVVLSGEDKGKTGEVVKAMPKEGKVVVQGINLVKRHTKPSQTTPGGIVTKEAPIHVSNVAVVVRKRAFDIADCSFIENQGIFSVYVYLDVVNGLPAAVLYLFRPFRDVFCR